MTARYDTLLTDAKAEIERLRVERDALIQRIFELGEQVYTPDGFVLFLTTPLDEFDGCTGLALILNGEAKRVLQALADDWDGLGY
jgi:hypothetical protein